MAKSITGGKKVISKGTVENKKFFRIPGTAQLLMELGVKYRFGTDNAEYNKEV